MRSILNAYRKLPAFVYYLVIAEFFIQLISSSFFLLLNYYLQDQGYSEADVGHFNSWRFIAVMLLALPFGFFIRGRKLKPIFLLGTFAVPLFSVLVIYAIATHHTSWVKLLMFCWGFSFMFIQVAGLPFIIQNVRKKYRPEAISLFFQTYGLSMMLAGLLNYLLKNYFPETFDEKNLLLFFSFLGFASVFFVLLMKPDEKPDMENVYQRGLSHKENIFRMANAYDWRVIFRVEFPTLIIATGAGFTIPFINLFFRNVHHVQSEDFSLLTSLASILVSIGAFFIPHIRKQYGFHIAITAFQTLAILALILMATTEWYASAGFAVYLASFLYVIRQPLMNVAGPATSELTLNYAGKKNREIISSLSSAIWSGSWFISSIIFAWLKELKVSYSNIIFMTSALYCLGVVWYYMLINEYKTKINSGEIVEDEHD